MSKILIIGGVAAGAGCAARLRRLDEKAQIIMLERGEYISYANCGLPYHVGDVIQSRDALLVTKPEVMRERFNVDVRTRNEALSIDRGSKSVRIKDHVTGLYGKVYAAKHGEITEMLLQSNDFQNRRAHDSASSSTVILLLLSLCDPQIV